MEKSESKSSDRGMTETSESLNPASKRARDEQSCPSVEVLSKEARTHLSTDAESSEAGCGGIDSEGVPNSGRKLKSFFDFDKHRATIILQMGDILALRDEYGMPRHYARFDNNCYGGIKFLDHKKNFYYRDRYKPNNSCRACGIFGIKKGSTMESLDRKLFSHKIERWERDSPNIYKIYPRKGEVWAVSKGSSTVLFLGGSPTTENYQLVEVVEDYNPERGTMVVHLARVKGGYRSLFHRYKMKSAEVPFCISPERNDMDKFSHQVPCFRGSGEKTIDGCLELDPSLLPLYIVEPETDINPEINDNYLCLGFLDQKIRESCVISSGFAAYDDQHRIPITYVIINTETKSETCELVPRPFNENEKRWQEAGLHIAAGRSFVKRPIKTKDGLIFSHRIHLFRRETSGGTYEISPQPGDVWAIYKDSNMLNSCNPGGLLEYKIGYIVHKTARGIEVSYLVRVDGFKCLFKFKNASAGKLFPEVDELIPAADEFRRLSHQIPSCKFSSPDSRYLREGSIVLDPLLVPEKGEEYFSFCDFPFLERSKAHPQIALQHFVDEERKRLSISSQEKLCEQSKVCQRNFIEEEDDTCVLTAGQRGGSVEENEGHSFSYCNPSHLQKSEADLVHPASGPLIDKEKNRRNLNNQEMRCPPSQICSKNLSEEQENARGRNPEETAHVAVHGNEEAQPTSHETNCRQLGMKFYEFDDSDTEETFELGQIWALYSEVDGLPHSYARINNFISLEGQVEVTPLEPHPMDDIEMQWDTENLPMSCGTFRESKSTCVKEVTVFSYRVICDEGTASKFYRIFPRKGDVWAIYKNWDSNWTSSDMKNNLEYILVEVVSGFTEEIGVTVAALVRAEGHEAVFRRHLNGCFELIKTFTRNELLRFSHCIPSRKINRDEEGNTCEGSIKLKFSHKGI